jgi:hypothetical protein
MAMAHCLITYTAFFDTVRKLFPEVWKSVSSVDVRDLSNFKNRGAVVIDDKAAGENANDMFHDKAKTDLGDIGIPAPHPGHSTKDSEQFRRQLYDQMAKGLVQYITESADIVANKNIQLSKIKYRLEQELPDKACAAYEAQYLILAQDFPEFFVWATLHEHREVVRTSTELLRQVTLVSEAVASLDLGFTKLAAAVAQGPAQLKLDSSSESAVVSESLHRIYDSEIKKAIIDDPYDRDQPGPTLRYPLKETIFVPQAYRIAHYLGPQVRLEDEGEWTRRPTNEDLGPFIVRYLQSVYSIEAPILVLGHPGSGKSLLTEMIAARLAYPAYTVIRVELRDIDPDAEVQTQIQDQIYKDTGRSVNWADFADQLRDNPPLIILDGYDELLQASGKVFADYLERVHKFQQREAIQGRPVRIMITSRITLIDKARIPAGSTVLRLLDFDVPRQRIWIEEWNRCNDAYLSQANVSPFSLTHTSKVASLAAQPLLLLMLALYDSADNQLSRRPNIDQTLLYYSLLQRFITRERSKGVEGQEFLALDESTRSSLVDQDMQRLGIAALGMFNRQSVSIRQKELSEDVAFFGAERETVGGLGTRLTQGDLLLGSFFFIHESKARTSVQQTNEGIGPSAFEFLHNTFGEFLAADFILRRVLDETAALSLMAKNNQLRSMLDQRLQAISEEWFSCFIHTPMHTRPVILRMMKEWAVHQLSQRGFTRTELLQSLDMIVLAQLKTILTGPAVLGLGSPGKSPYRPLPLLGHLSIYSLNLILLRITLSEGVFYLNEQDLGDEYGASRAWDRLTYLWRSWHSLESLVGVAAVMTARREGAKIELRSASSNADLTGPRLADVLTVGMALGDKISAGLAGLHLASLVPSEHALVQTLNRDLLDEGLDLSSISVSLLAKYSTGTIDPEFMDVLRFGNIREYVPFDRVMREAVQYTLPSASVNSVASIGATPIDYVTELSYRYDIELEIALRERWEPRWLPDLLVSPKPKGGWRKFLKTSAAAPVFRRAFEVFPNSHLIHVATLVDNSLRGKLGDVFDAETALLVAALGDATGISSLRDTGLNALIKGISASHWKFGDIPIVTFERLGDIFWASEPELSEYRSFIGSLLEHELNTLVHDEGFLYAASNLPFIITALRINGLSDKMRELLMGRAAEGLRGCIAYPNKRVFKWVMSIWQVAAQAGDTDHLLPLFESPIGAAALRPGHSGPHTRLLDDLARERDLLADQLHGDLALISEILNSYQEHGGKESS